MSAPETRGAALDVPDSSASAGPPDVLVAVVSYNSAAPLPGLLASLPDGMRDPGTGRSLTWCTVLADNDSADDSVAVARAADPDLVVVPMGRNAGYAAGINAAVAALAHRVGLPRRGVLVLNPDVRLDPGCVPRLVETLERDGAGIAVPRLRDAAGERIDSQRREPTLVRALADALVGAERAGRWGRLGEVVTDERRYAEATDTDWAEGSTQLVSTPCWERCGTWDERFFLYSEEAEYDLRARDAGLPTRYDPAAGAVHLEGGSAGSSRLWPLLVVNRLRLYRMRAGLPASAVFWLLLVLREGSRAALGKATSRAALADLLSPARLREPKGPGWLR